MSTLPQKQKPAAQSEKLNRYNEILCKQDRCNHIKRKIGASIKKQIEQYYLLFEAL